MKYRKQKTGQLLAQGPEAETLRGRKFIGASEAKAIKFIKV